MTDGGEVPGTAEWLPEVLWTRAVSRLPRTSSVRVQQAAWVLSGFLFGVAVTHALGLSVGSTVVAGLITGVLSWLGRGVVTVLVAGCLTLGALGVVLRLTIIAFPHEAWSMHWLLPLAFLLLVAAVVVARRCGFGDHAGARLASSLLELAAGGSSLALVLLCVHRIGHASASLILLSSEDNAAWLNTVAGLRDAHGVTADTTPQIEIFGPVLNTFLAFTREVSGGLLPHAVPISRTASVVLSSHVVLIAVAPVVAALLARRTLRYDRALFTLLTWAGVSAVIVTYSLVAPQHGFLSTALAIMLVIVAACLFPGGTPDVLQWTGVVRWLAVALGLYVASSAWIAITPLGGAALLAWWLAVAVPALRWGPWRRVHVVGAFLVLTLLMCLALYLQYRTVVGPVGGGEGLFVSTGGTPAATTTMIVTALGLAAGCRFLYRRADPGGPATLAFPLAALVAYVAVAMLTEGYLTGEPPHYGTIKLLYVTVGLALVLGLADLLASPALGAVRLDAAALLLVAALFAGTVEQGPMLQAATSHWPKPQLPTIWIKQVTREVTKKPRVLCLGLTAAPDTSQASLDAYLCDRWAASLQGLDDDPGADWRAVQLGRLPVAQAVARIKAAHDLPWTIVVIGSLTKLKDPKAWYAPIAAQPGLHFISSGF